MESNVQTSDEKIDYIVSRYYKYKLYKKKFYVNFKQVKNSISVSTLSVICFGVLHFNVWIFRLLGNQRSKFSNPLSCNVRTTHLKNKGNVCKSWFISNLRDNLTRSNVVYKDQTTSRCRRLYVTLMGVAVTCWFNGLFNQGLVISWIPLNSEFRNESVHVLFLVFFRGFEIIHPNFYQKNPYTKYVRKDNRKGVIIKRQRVKVQFYVSSFQQVS